MCTEIKADKKEKKPFEKRPNQVHSQSSWSECINSDSRGLLDILTIPNITHTYETPYELWHSFSSLLIFCWFVFNFNQL